MSEQKDAYDNQVKILDVKNNKLNQEVAVLKEMEQRLNALLIEKQEVENECHEIKSKLEYRDGDKEHLVVQLESLSEKLQIQQMDFIEESKKLREKVSQYEREILAKGDRIKELEAASSTQGKKYDEEVDALNGRIDIIKAELEGAREEKGKLEEVHQTAQRELVLLRARVDQMAAAEVGKMSEIKQLKTELESLQYQKNRDEAAFTQRLSELEKGNVDLRSQLEAIQALNKEVKNTGKPDASPKEVKSEVDKASIFEVIKQHCQGTLSDDVIRRAVSEGFSVDEEVVFSYEPSELANEVNSYLRSIVLSGSSTAKSDKGLPLDSQRESRENSLGKGVDEDQAKDLYGYLKSQKDKYEKPLVESEEVFREMLRGVDFNIYRKDLLVFSLQNFRKLQVCEKPYLTDEMFSTVLMNGDLAEDPEALDLPDDIGEDDRKFLLEEARENVNKKAKAAFFHACKCKNFTPDTTGVDLVKEKKLNPAGNGLYNWSNMCFMNSFFQFFSHYLKTSDVLEILEDGVPLSTVTRIIEKKMPQALLTQGQRDSWEALSPAERKNKVDVYARECVANPDQVLKMNKPVAIAKEFEDFIGFRNSFVTLCKRLREKGEESETLLEYQKDFLQKYLALGACVGRAEQVLDAKETDGLILANIAQQDPDELLRDIMTLLGIEEQENLCLGIQDSKRLILNNRPVYETMALTREPLPVISLEVARGRQATLENSLKQFLQPEQLDRDNAFRWSERELKAVGAENKPVQTEKYLKLTTFGGTPPRQLMVQSKIFNNQGGKLASEGQAILQNLGEDRKLTIPVSQPDGSPVYAGYQVNSVVCHRGDTITSGHFITLKFEGGKVIVCDDDIVLDLENYARFHGRPPYKNWQDFCKQERLSGYLYSLELTEITDKSPNAQSYAPAEPEADSKHVRDVDPQTGQKKHMASSPLSGLSSSPASPNWPTHAEILTSIREQPKRNLVDKSGGLVPDADDEYYRVLESMSHVGIPGKENAKVFLGGFRSDVFEGTCHNFGDYELIIHLNQSATAGYSDNNKGTTKDYHDKHQIKEGTAVLSYDFDDNPKENAKAWPYMQSKMEEISVAIEAAVRDGKKVYIHCSNGQSRSVAVYIWFLSTRLGLSFDQAKAYIQDKRPILKCKFEDELKAALQNADLQ